MPTVAFLGCVEFGIVLLEGQGLGTLGLKIQNEEIRIPARVSPMCL